MESRDLLLMRRTHALVLGLLTALTGGEILAQALPARFEHDRVFLEATAPDGKPVRLYTDTGGGFNTIATSVAERYSLEPAGQFESDEEKGELVAFPAFLIDAGIPRPSQDPWMRGNLVVVPDNALETQGFLGTRWFAERIWQFDYGRKTLRRLDSFEPTARYVTLALGFKHDADGKRSLNFPRLTVAIDGQPLEVLLDTGATGELTEHSAAVYGLPVGSRVAASYVTELHFKHWQSRHPDWRVVEQAEAVTGTAFPMIEVPVVDFGGVRVGPVWFSQRPDPIFHQWMSQMMDRQIDGAIGGSALKYLEIVIDYPNAKVHIAPLAPADR